MKTKISLDFVAVLEIVFITLKLCSVIDWSWWWVLAPIWLSLGIFLVVMAIGIVVLKHW